MIVEDLTQSEYFITRPLYIPLKGKKHVMFDGSNALAIHQFYKTKFIDMSIVETSVVIALNNANSIMGYTVLGTGGLDATYMNIQNICKFAIDTLALKIILVHNHPAGRMVISLQDEDITFRAITALKIHGISLVDHIILSGINEDYVSFAKRGIINVLSQRANKLIKSLKDY